MYYKVSTIPLSLLPPQMKEIPNPPQEVFLSGTLPNKKHTLLVIGTDSPTEYGMFVTEMLVKGLSGYNVSILAPLTEGISALAVHTAHSGDIQATLVPATGLDPKILQPKSLHALVGACLEKGGGIISLSNTDTLTKESIQRRNRLLAGLCDSVLVIEGEEYSQTTETALLCLEYNKQVLVVPGDIRDKESTGSNMLIRMGGTPILSVPTLLDALSLERKSTHMEPDMDEKYILSVLTTPKSISEIVSLLPYDEEEILEIILRMEMKEMIIQRLGKVEKM